jgi:hypothetical protein
MSHDNINLTADIYAWLVSIEVLDFNTTNLIINEDGDIKLDNQLSDRIKNGCFFKNLFIKFNSLLNILYGNIFRLDEKLENLEDFNDNQVKLKNWNIIAEFASSYYGIKIDSDYKTLLIAVDQITFKDLFQKMYDFYLNLEEKVKRKKELGEAVPKDKTVIEKVNDRFNKDFNEGYLNNNHNNHNNNNNNNNNNLKGKFI